MTDEHLRELATLQQDKYPSAWADLARTVLRVLDERDALRDRVSELEARPPVAYVPAARCEACRGRGRFDVSPRCLWCDGTGLEHPVRTGPTEDAT